MERPQHLLMRCAIGIHFGDLDLALETYKLLSQKFFTHATPTLFNAGIWAGRERARGQAESKVLLQTVRRKCFPINQNCAAR